MTTTQLTQLKNAGFTLDQIAAIGKIFDPEKPKSEKSDADQPSKSALKAAEDARKAYERGKKEAEDRQREKDMGPLIRYKPADDSWERNGKAFRDAEFERRRKEFRETQRKSLFLGAMVVPPRYDFGPGPYEMETIKLQPL